MPDRLDLSNPADAEHLRRHRPGRPSRIDRDLELRAFIEAHILQTTFPELDALARAQFGDDATSASAIHRWWQRNAARLLQDLAISPHGDGGAAGPSPTGVPGSNMHGGLDERARCLWCERPFPPRRTGGREQEFCGRDCRQAFHGAARRWAAAAVRDGRLSVDELRSAGDSGKRRGEEKSIAEISD